MYSQITSAPSEGFLGINNGGQVGSHPSTSYAGNSVPLVTITFKVKTGLTPGEHKSVVSVGSADNPIVLTSTSSGGASIITDKRLGDVQRHSCSNPRVVCIKLRNLQN